MSERSKGDTSSSLAAVPPTTGRVVKNPLLSASVTGLTFDDFHNKPLLLPAAPPIVHPTPVVSRESTPLVTVGKSSDIDTENLSEINLNETSQVPANILSSSDENSNSLIESTNQIDNSILSQAASSFSQLPSVASSVFSTFSKKFNPSSGREDFNSNSQLDIQPFSTPFAGQTAVQQSNILPPPPVFRNQQYQQNQDIASSIQNQPQAPPAEPPTFYSPTEVPPAPSGPTCPPPATGQNTYRLSAKKKIYAPIPGLSASHQEPSLPAPTTGFTAPIGFETLDAPSYTERSTYEKSEERKGGLFSLTNLGVPGVLQNLSGFVQSAAGISQKPAESAPATNFGSNYFPQTGQNNFSGIEHVQSIPSEQGTSEITSHSVPTVGEFSQYTQGPSTTGTQFLTQPPKSSTPETRQTLFASEQSIYQPTSTASFSRPPSAENKLEGQHNNSHIPDISPFLNTVPPQQTELSSHFRPPQPESTFSGPPPKSVTPDSSRQIVEQAATPQPINLFGPLPTAGTSFSEPLPKSDTFKSSSQLPSNLEQVNSAPPPNFFRPPPISEGNFSGPLASTGPTANYFGASSTAGAFFAGPPPTAGTNLSGLPPKSVTPESNLIPQQAQSLSSTNIFGPPPQIKAPIAGPPSAVPPSSFRLQKGTRLYKSPFGVAPSEYQSKVQVSQNNFPPAPETVSFFNPQQAFAQPQGQGIQQQISTQQPLLNTVQEASIIPPKDTSGLHALVTAPTLGIAPENQATAEVVNFFIPKEKEAVPLNILDPQSTQDEVSSTKYPNSLSPKVTPPIDKDSECSNNSLSCANVATTEKTTENPQIDEGSVPQEATLPPTKLNTDTACNQDKSLVSDTNVFTQENYFSNQTPEQNKSESSDQKSALDVIAQRNILPPPPAVNFGTSSPSKETANFPPPPPQQSFQNKPISNPYRKGLQPIHSQLSAPLALSSFFTPIDQGNNFFQTISSGPVSEVPQPTETNFVNPQDNSLNPVPDTFKEPEQSSQETFPVLETFQTLEESTQEESKLRDEIPTQSENQQPEIELSGLLPTLPIRQQTPISSAIPDQDTRTTIGEQLSSQTIEPAENPLSFYKPDIAPPQSNELPVASKPEESSKIASPLKSGDTPAPETAPNLFTGFFDQPAAAPVAAPNPITVQRPSLPDPTTFFDSFSLVPSLGIPAAPTEDPNSQRIQNFFNNPPPKELDTVGDLNYNLVGSGLSVQNLQIRSLTPASNLAEPPSSSCSEFSELNSSLSAANRQPLIQAADSTKVSPEEEAIFESPEYQDLPEEIVNELKMANSLLGNSSPTNEVYKPAVKHWFYKKKLDVKCLWTPFSFHDSALLEEAFLKGDEGPNLVAVEGGRFDVNISERTKSPVYWEGEAIEVKRCSWFYKANDSKYVPYEEETADLLEEEYKKASESCEWHKKIPISAGDIVVFHGPTVIVHFQPQQQVDSWGGATLDSENFLSHLKQQTITRPRVVKRDLEDFNIDEGESDKVDHLLFMVHGIGSACDLKMRSVEEVVDEFRGIALQLVQSHYKNSVESGCVGRVEVLPVSWHSELHSEEFGIDEKLKSITLESIPKLRNFTNDTLLDILFYTSPMFCQRIINTVTSSMNEIFLKYKQRNPEFRGEVSLAGHSLGSLIMFDLLCHQRPHKQSEDKNMENPSATTSDSPVESNRLKEEEEGKNITYKMGQAGTGQPFISYPQLLFQPKKFFALGSPIGMFVTIRGIDKLGLDFRLPTCPGFYNIFHPYDPVAYRIEALVNPDMNGIPPVLIPHHKGRKRMHLELKETMSRVGADLKQRFFETFKTTLDSVNFLTPKAKNDPKELKEEVDRLLELQAQQGQNTQQNTATTSRSRANSNSTNQSDTDVIEIDFPLGKLNDSKRVDYVLQEAPLEFFNEYLFALSSHVCYWESEDTILFVIKQIYNEIGISPDSQVPQQTMTIERPCSSGSTTQQSPTS